MRCSAKTKSGKRCRNKAQANAEFCGVHSKPAKDGGSTFEYDVFLSYSSKDKKTVHALAERLRKDGLRVWLDAWVIQPGDSIPMSIQHGVEKSRTLLMCMSRAYFESEWGKLEHHSMLFRDPTNAQRRFIPLLIKDCAPPDIIAQFAHIDWRKSSVAAYEELRAACRLDKRETEEPSVPVHQTDQCRMVMKGHSQGVDCVAVTPDGKTVVSGSVDKTLKVWDLNTGQCRATLKGSTGEVRCVATTQNGRTVVSGSVDNTLRVWTLKTGQCRATHTWHNESVNAVAITSDGKTAVSLSFDGSIKVWDVEYGRCIRTVEVISEYGFPFPAQIAVSPDGRKIISGTGSPGSIAVWDGETGEQLSVLHGHGGNVRVALTPDGTKIVSGSTDRTLKIWDVESGQCLATFEGHSKPVWSVAVTPDGKRVVSASADETVKVWDLATGHCIATFEGHSDDVVGLAVSPDSKTVISCSVDKTLRVWDLPAPDITPEDADVARYTNAKVVLVGESGVGKTGLAMRLCEDRWEATESTHGMVVERLELPSVPGSEEEDGLEREVWLWDFAGQPDYRLIHQLYMDETALGVLVFDPQDDNPFENIGYWDKALSAATKHDPGKLLVAGRCDRGGITISDKRIERYVEEHGFADFLITGAKTGDGCAELQAAIAKHIPWERLPWTATSGLFKTLKDAILKFTEEDAPLARLSELRQRLQLSLPEETIDESDLRTVVGLMQSQGVVQMLGFGDFALFQPEWINRYASVVVRMAREHADEMGVVPEQCVLDGRLEYKGMERLGEADEKILLRAMVQTFLDRSLCIREETRKGNLLVFPSFFRRDKPDQPEHPNVFVTYKFSGPLDDIYTTLVVRLNYSGVFEKGELWKDAADFKTPEGKRVGLAMTKKPEGAAEIVIYFEGDTPDDTKVTFIKYVHEHLLAKAQPRESVTRVRTYVCPHCHQPLENLRAIQNRLKKGLKDIVCADCDARVPLFDLIEEKFASDEFSRRVRDLDEQARINLDNESKELILVGHAMAIAGEAGQIYRITAQPDWGIDAEIEFKNSKGEASGKRVYLQLKSGDSYLYKRQRDNAEVFTIKKKRQAEYWLSQAYPVMLVIRSSDGKIRWMNITEYLQHHGVGTKQVVFKGEAFTAPNVALMRNTILGAE